MKSLLLSVLFLVALTPSLFAQFSPQQEVVGGGMTTVTFQNGVLPDASYSGITDTYINQTNNTTNYDAATDLLYEYAESKVLIKFDPQGYLFGDEWIHRARLHLYMSAETAGNGTEFLTTFNRIMRDWTDDEVTWDDAKTDTTWTTAGAASTDGTFTLFGGDAKKIEYRWNIAQTTWSTRSTDQTFGQDSLYSGYGAATTLDVGYGPVDMELWLVDAPPGYVDAPKWVVFDITKMFRGHHEGWWADFGFLMDEYYGNGGEATFSSSENATAADRPKIEIEYVQSRGRRKAGTPSPFVGIN